MARLAKLGITVRPATLPAAAPVNTCRIDDPVSLIAASDPTAGPRLIQFPDKPLLSCGMAEQLARFAADIAAPLVLGIYGETLDAISTGPGYECRPRNRQSGAKVSSHGQGLAVDISTISLTKGKQISIEKPQGPHDVRFIAAFRAAACGAFNTVLGPGSDLAHANHIHLDLESRGRDGRSKFCQ